jgi:hypothetical protein
VAQDFLVGVEKAISSLTMDGFDGKPFRQMLRETQQASSGVLALELSNGDLDECSASVKESDDDMSSFIAAGGESGLGAARTLIAQGAVRNYRAFSNMGYYDHVNDAASREGTSPREKSAKSVFTQDLLRRLLLRDPQKSRLSHGHQFTSQLRHCGKRDLFQWPHDPLREMHYPDQEQDVFNPMICRVYLTHNHFRCHHIMRMHGTLHL